MIPAHLAAGSVPDPAAPHVSLWNSEGFYALNPEAAEHRVQIDHHDDSGRLVGSFVAARIDDALVSGFGAPLGGVDFVRDDEIPRHVVHLLRTVFEAAAAGGARRVEVRMKPPHHGAAEAALAFALFELGAEVELANLNFFVDVGHLDQGVALLTPRAVKAARRAAEAGARVELLAPDDETEWATAYEVLERNRVEKGRPMRLSLEYIRRIRDHFGPLVRMHALRDGDGAMVAAALLYRTAACHDVVQYWGDVAPSGPVSPMPLLALELFTAAKAAGASVVDLGIATSDGQPNHGLVQFKRSVGARSELRLEVAADVDSVLRSPRWARLDA